MRILVTGFEPFDGALENPSAWIVHRLAAEHTRGDDDGLVTAILPVSATRMPPRLSELLDASQPEIVLLLGEARGAPAIRVERVALNLLDFRIHDNDGKSYRDLAVRIGGPDAYFATLPVGEIAHALAELGIPCELSLSAGTYLCNQAMYLALDWAAGRAAASPPRVGFVHLPTPGPAMSLEDEYRGVCHVIELLGTGD